MIYRKYNYKIDFRLSGFSNSLHRPRNNQSAMDKMSLNQSQIRMLYASLWHSGYV